MGVFAYLLFLPIFLLTNCQNEFDEPVLSSQTDVNRDLEVLLLMKSAIVSDSDYASLNKESAFKSTDPASSDQCTQFQYPMTFEVYSGDNPNPELYEINSDEELVAFVDMLVASQNNFQYYIYFPITLLDTDGNKTVLNDLTELEGTLNMAVEACEGMNDGTSGGGTESGTGTGGTGTDGGTSADGGTGTEGGSGTDGSGGSTGSDGGTGTDGSDGGAGTTSADEGSTGTTSSDGSGESTGSDNGSESTGSDGGSDGGTGTDNSGDGSSGGDSSNGDDDSGDESDDDGYDDDGDDDDDFVEVSESDDDGYQYCDKKAKKVVICHKGVTICISVNAIWGHMQHHEEDYFGKCED